MHRRLLPVHSVRRPLHPDTDRPRTTGPLDSLASAMNASPDEVRGGIA
jgi:hypothetical protein